MKKLQCLLIMLLGILPLYSYEWIVDEEFDQMARWEPLLFPKIDKHSQYTLMKEAGRDFLQADSNDSASGLIFRETFNVYENPVMTWRWKVDGVYKTGDARTKKGDDYPIRIYIIFEFDPEKSRGFQKFQYDIAKAIYGEYPPDSSINYVWANRDWGGIEFMPNQYTDKAMMIARNWGEGEAGVWQENWANIIADYKALFGKEPPETASLAVMSDSDDTGETGSAQIDYIRVGSQ